MPTYFFKDKETEEIQEVFMSIHKLDDYKKENPNLKQIVTSGNEFITGVKSARQLAGTEWNNLLTKIKKGSGKGSTIRD